jgi:cobalt-precorrin 5A hydrolase / precorrin-3B C17-methyltransferase
LIGLVYVTAAGQAGAQQLASAWPDRTRIYHPPAAAAVPAAFAECTGLVVFLAAGATVRLLAPLLAAGGKATEPAVVCVDQAHHYAISLLCGHQGGGNQLAARVAEVLGATAVISTATDATSLPGLDDLGLPASGDIAGVARAMLDGEPVRLLLERSWPLPAFPPNVTDLNADSTILVTDRVVPEKPQQVVIHPPTLALGIGASTGADPEELLTLVQRVLAEASLDEASIRQVLTIDRKAEEPAIQALGERLGVPVRGFTSEQLGEYPVPNPSEVVRAAVGTPSVCEAALLAAGAELVVTKQRGQTVTVAVGRFPARGSLALVGIGPGARDLLTPRAVAQLRAASVVVGLELYLAQVRDLLRPGTLQVSNGMGGESERVSTAVAHAQAGKAVALIGSGDTGVYAMASPALETLANALATGGPQIDVIGVPGVTAALAAANLLGAPLGNDHAYISLSDLHTPWETIERRLRAAADGDFTVALYNPRSRGRTDHLPRALEILGAQRPGSTPIGLVRNAFRPGQRVEITSFTDFNEEIMERVDMLTVVVVGASDTRVIAGHMVTPRGYRWMAGS